MMLVCYGPLADDYMCKLLFFIKIKDFKKFSNLIEIFEQSDSYLVSERIHCCIVFLLSIMYDSTSAIPFLKLVLFADV